MVMNQQMKCVNLYKVSKDRVHPCMHEQLCQHGWEMSKEDWKERYLPFTRDQPSRHEWWSTIEMYQNQHYDAGSTALFM